MLKKLSHWRRGRLHDTISRFVILLDVVFLVVSAPLRDSLFCMETFFEFRIRKLRGLKEWISATLCLMSLRQCGTKSKGHL